jgi:predicted trehalose synthase
VDLTVWAAREGEIRLAHLGSRWSHARGVAGRAEEIAGAVDPHDRAVLIAAAYLHDVGYAAELVVHGFHPLDGALWLRAQGQVRLAGLVAHHTGARFEADAHGLGDALAAFHDERSPVSDALAYSDLMTGPNGEPMSVAERLGEIERRYGPGSLVVRALEDASSTLEAMIRRTEARLAGLRVDAA